MPPRKTSKTPHYLPGVPLAFLDVETTGLSPSAGHRVCEIAILRIETDGTERVFESLVNPKRRISAGAFAVNGITEDMVRTAPPFPELLPAMDEKFAGAVLVAHNAPFDLGFLESEFRRAGRTAAFERVIDTLGIARTLLPGVPHSLPALRRALGVRVTGAHRAMADCRATRGVLDSLIARHWPDAPPAVEDLINVARQFNPEPIPLEALPDDLVAALRQSSRLWIEYESSEGAVSQRWIEVRSAAEAGGKQYLVAFCEERQAERHFRLDRICTWKSDCPHPPAARVSIDREYTVTADGLLIRPLQEEELAALPDLWIASGLTHKPKGRDKIKNLTKQYYSGSAEFFGAFVEGRLVGSVIATDDSRRGWINRLAVHPDYRGREIARALIHSAEEHFRGLGIKVLDALIDADNAPSRRLFTSEGYVEKPDILYFTKRPSRDA